MNRIFNKGRNILDKYLGFYFLAVIFLWIKTYIAQLTQFKLGIENPFQQFLLLFNPIGSSLLFLGLAFFFKGRKKYIGLMVIYLILSLLLYSNILYYRFFNDFITLPTLSQTQNFGDVSSSVVSLLKPYDFLFFIDFLLLGSLLVFQRVKIEIKDMDRSKVSAIFSLSFALTFANIGFAEIDRPELLTRGFDRNYIVKYIGMYDYTIYDTVQSTKASAARVLADSNDITAVLNYTKSNYAEPDPTYFGA